MLDAGSIKDLSSVRAAGITILRDTCKAGMFEYPAPTIDELGEITPECLQKVICRQLKTDYLNRANSPKNLIEQRKAESKKLLDDETLTDDQKVKRMFSLIQQGR